MDLEDAVPLPASASLDKPDAGEASSLPTAQSSVPLQALDLEALEDTRAAMKDKFPMMVSFYLEDSADYLNALNAVIESGHIDQAVSPAHTLKSSSRQLGTVEVSDIAKQVEERAREWGESNGQQGGDIASPIKRLHEAYGVAKTEPKEQLAKAA